MLTQTDCKPSPLTLLSEEENLFYSTVRQFADDTIAPLVRAMDEEQKISPGLVEKIFDLGIMAIEIPESFGGAGGSFFDSVLAIEAISTVDPAIAVLVDVHNTLVINALRRWATDAQQRLWLPKLASGTVGAYALSESGSGSDAFALQMEAIVADTAGDVHGEHQREIGVRRSGESRRGCEKKGDEGQGAAEHLGRKTL